jgi:predicted nucleic acid-binding Zn ribbon protein
MTRKTTWEKKRMLLPNKPLREVCAYCEINPPYKPSLFCSHSCAEMWTKEELRRQKEGILQCRNE